VEPRERPASELRDRWYPSPTTEHGEVVTPSLPDGFRTELGGHLATVQFSYEAWGTRNEAGDNTILVVHPLTADPHVTGGFAEQELGWWEPIVGPGRAIDTDRFHVVCPNLLGGCYGSTGPSFPDPVDGAPYGDRFPLLTPRDLMRAQRLFLDALGIRSLACVVGPSMGGMVVWEWLFEEPAIAPAGIVVAAPLVSGPYQIGLSWLQRAGIDLDRGASAGRGGRILARGVGMMSYRSPRGLHEKFGRGWFQPPGATLAEPGVYNVESWLAHHGKRLLKRFDPLTYALFSRTMDLHDVTRGRGSLEEALARLRGRALLVAISSDQLYPAADLRADAEALRAAGAPVQYEEIHSDNGHDGFLLDVEPLGGLVRTFLGA